jgi:hypothetical protein
MSHVYLSKSDLAWRHAIMGGFWRSYYGLLAIIYNALGFISFLRLEGLFRASPASPGVRVLMAAMFFILQIGLNVYMWQLCRSTSRELSDPDIEAAKEKDILGYSRKAFRMCLVGLFAFFVSSTLMVL